MNLPSLEPAWDAADYVQVGVAPFTEAYPMLRPHTIYVQIKDAVMATGEVAPASMANSGTPSEHSRRTASTAFSPWNPAWDRRIPSADSPGRNFIRATKAFTGLLQDEKIDYA
ncbi:MAG: hypothetical protein ABJD68_14850 [Nakamurella sp.]